MRRIGGQHFVHAIEPCGLRGNIFHAATGNQQMHFAEFGGGGNGVQRGGI